MSGDQFALVIEGVERVELDPNSEYYVRAALGQLKVGTQWTTIENDALQYNAHTMLPNECMDDQILSLELINSNDQIVGMRRVLEWRKRMNNLEKGVLKVGLYSPNVTLENEASPVAQRDEFGNMKPPRERPVGVARVRLYLAPRYKELQEQYDRLDVFVGRLSDVIVKELLTEPPHVLVSLGTTSGIALPSTAKPIDNDDGWEWEETLPFLYQGECELVVSVRDPVSDRELGRGTLFISQVAYNLNKLQVASTIRGESDKVHKLAGSIPICDDYGAHIGLMLIGAELWTHDHFHKKLNDKMHDGLPALERRLDFDESLLKELVKDSDAADAAANAAEEATRQSQSSAAPPPPLDGQPPNTPPPPPPPGPSQNRRSLPKGEFLVAANRLSEIRNALEKLKVEHNVPHHELISRRELRKLRDLELEQAKQLQQRLRAEESNLFQIACDIAKAMDIDVITNCENARSMIRRCHLDLSSSPRMAVRPVSLAEIEQRLQQAENLEARSKSLKQNVYSPERLNDLLPAIDQLSNCVDESRRLHLNLIDINDEIRLRNEEAKRAMRFEQVKAQEMKYDQQPPVVVQKTGLNCFACCVPERNIYDDQVDIVGPDNLVSESLERFTDPAAA